MKYIYIITALKLHRTSGIVEASTPVVGLVSCPVSLDLFPALCLGPCSPTISDVGLKSQLSIV